MACSFVCTRVDILGRELVLKTEWTPLSVVLSKNVNQFLRHGNQQQKQLFDWKGSDNKKTPVTKSKSTTPTSNPRPTTTALTTPTTDLFIIITFIIFYHHNQLPLSFSINHHLNHYHLSSIKTTTIIRIFILIFYNKPQNLSNPPPPSFFYFGQIEVSKSPKSFISRGPIRQFIAQILKKSGNLSISVGKFVYVQWKRVSFFFSLRLLIPYR